MRNLNGIKWVFALALIGGSANADIVIDNQLIPSNDILSIIILPNTGQINISTTGYTVTKDSTDPSDPVAVSITSFSASPSTITEGGSTTVSWSTQNADSCAVSDNADQLNGPVEVSGSAILTIATAGNYTLTLTCQGSSGPVSRTISIAVNAPAPTPTTTCTASPLSGVTKSWNGFWGLNFPLPGYANKNATIARSGYLALKFETGSIVDNGYLATVGNTITSGVRKGSISECPGDFKVTRACSHVWGIGGGISWATDGTANVCQLKPNTTYYFNITFTDGFDPKSSTCTSSNCIATIQHVNP